MFTGVWQARLLLSSKNIMDRKLNVYKKYDFIEPMQVIYCEINSETT